MFFRPDFDECGSNPCMNGGNCTDHLNGYACTCAPGYNGTECEIGTIFLINEFVFH